MYSLLVKLAQIKLLSMIYTGVPRRAKVIRQGSRCISGMRRALICSSHQTTSERESAVALTPWSNLPEFMNILQSPKFIHFLPGTHWDPR